VPAQRISRHKAYSPGTEPVAGGRPKLRPSGGTINYADLGQLSLFGGTATRSFYRARRCSIRLGDERPPVRALHATRPVSTVPCKAKGGWRTKAKPAVKLRGRSEGRPKAAL